MAYSSKLREEEIKNKLRQDYFKDYDSTPILGNIDFAVAVPIEGMQLFETEYLLWAESKKGVQFDIYESFVQLILTIGKARTFEKHLPPAFLGAFDAEKIAFISYNSVLDIFYQNDFNWNVTPSDHSTREFQQVLSIVRETLDSNMMLFRFDNDNRELKSFIKENFIVGKSRLSKIRINKNNFTAIYQKWIKEVKPSIVVNWEKAKQNGIIDADFYLADILSEHNVTLKEKLFVLLRNDHYELDRKIDEMGLFDSKTAQFNDKQKSHKHFWNRYKRPPKREYWDYIVNRRDLLVSQDVRERKGSYFTPKIWVELSQEYIASYLGEDWQDEYYIWDCAAGTGNLLAGLTNKYNIWASTIDKADVDVMHDRIKNGANLLDSHVFQFDFLNDDFSNLPKGLQEIINDEDKRKRLVIYINPPYAEADNRKGEGRSGVAVSIIQKKYEKEMGYAKRELYIQFLTRIYYELPSVTLVDFSKLKNLQAPKFADFRRAFMAKPEKIFIVPAATFDNVKGNFPISLTIWDTSKRSEFNSIEADVYNENGVYIGRKTIHAYDESEMINDWTLSFIDNSFERTKTGNISLGTIIGVGNDFQNQRLVRIERPFKKWNHQYQWQITPDNLIETSVYFTVRLIFQATWLNDRDQFLCPSPEWSDDVFFKSDCLTYTLFSPKNTFRQQDGINHWIPFTESEVNARDKFSSHFMTDFIKGKIRSITTKDDLFSSLGDNIPTSPIPFSDEATAVFNAGKELWKYYHSMGNSIPDASLYDMRLYFQGTKQSSNGKAKMNSESKDAIYTSLMKEVRNRLKILAKKIEPKVFEYGFLKSL